MRLRVLTEWRGSGPCGSVGEYPDPVAAAQLALGNAERVADAPVVEAAVPARDRVETAVAPPALGPRAKRRP